MNFDEVINCFGIYFVKWDMMELIYGVFVKDGIVMWVVDMDFCLL